MLKTQLENIKELIISDELKHALKNLHDLVRKNGFDSDFERSAISFRREFIALKKKQLGNTLSYDNFTAEENKLIERVLKFLELLEEEIDLLPDLSDKAVVKAAHPYFALACDRKLQHNQFWNLYEEKPNQRFFYFYIYGGEKQEHKALFDRLVYELDNSFYADFNPKEDINTQLNRVRAIQVPGIYSRLSYESVLLALLAALGIPSSKLDRLDNKRLTQVIKTSPVTQSLSPQDALFIRIPFNSNFWDKDKTPAIARNFIQQFCEEIDHGSCPRVFFFFSIEYEDEDVQLQQEVNDRVRKSDYIIPLPILQNVHKADVEAWFDSVGYNFLKLPSHIRQALFDQYFGKLPDAMAMREVRIKLEEIINQHYQ